MNDTITVDGIGYVSAERFDEKCEEMEKWQKRTLWLLREMKVLTMEKAEEWRKEEGYIE